MKFLLISLSISFWICCNGHSCGPAGYFEDYQQVTYRNSSSGYSTVEYFCLHPGYLIGNIRRKCQKSGLWDGGIPLCVQPAKGFIGNVTQSNKHHFQPDDIDIKTCLTDNNKQDQERCVLLPGTPLDRHLNFTFSQTYRVVAVRLHPAGFNITVKVFWNLTNPEGTHCDRDTTFLDFYKCVNPIEANFMTIDFSSRQSTLIKLNEVDIFEENDAANCSIPDIPAYGSFEFIDNRTVVNYSCDERHILFGNDTSYCLPNGTWSEPAPICQEICDNPINLRPVENGKWINVTQTFLTATVIVFLKLECDSGFELDGGPSSIVCLGSEGWSSTNATCVLVEKTTHKLRTNSEIEEPEQNYSSRDQSTRYFEDSSTSSPTNTFSGDSTKLIAVGTVSGIVSSILVMVGVLCIVFGRKRCTSQARVADSRRDSSYYHYYNGINYEEMDRVTMSSTSTSISVANRPPAKDPRIPDVLELVYENPSLYDQTSRNASAVETELSDCSRHIYSEVDDGQIYAEPYRNSRGSHRDSDDNEVFQDNDIYDEDV